MLSFPIVYAGQRFLLFSITSGRRDDVSSLVFLMGLLAGALGQEPWATESPRLFCLLPSLGGGWLQLSAMIIKRTLKGGKFINYYRDSINKYTEAVNLGDGQEEQEKTLLEKALQSAKECQRYLDEPISHLFSVDSLIKAITETINPDEIK